MKKLTLKASGLPIYFNASNVIAVYQDRVDSPTLIVTNNQTFEVVESVDAVEAEFSA